MAKTSLTLVGNSTDSRELAECRDLVYGNASHPREPVVLKNPAASILGHI
jgi:hypothetical protein